MQVPGYQSGTMIDINHVTAQIEVPHERYHASIRRTHRRALGARKVDPHVTALNDAVELSAIAEAARDPPRSWGYKSALPELLRLMRPATNLKRAFGLGLDSRRRCGVGRLPKLRSDTQLFHGVLARF